MKGAIVNRTKKAIIAVMVLLGLTVANTWNNRLFIDAALPDSERLTHCRVGGNSLQPAALLGPVVFRMGGT